MANSNNIDQTIQHFSHQHPLQLTKIPHNSQGISPCSGCKLQVTGCVYTCKPCNYTLHCSCSKMPKRINHPSDPNHPLTLFPSPVYSEGLFSCNACGREGTGFCFHCKECELDVHILCAAMQLQVNHASHRHPLLLCFSPPYPTQDFVCDICKSTGANHWLYRCSRCDFDAHLSCAVSPATTRVSTSTRTDTTGSSAAVKTKVTHEKYKATPPLPLRSQPLEEPMPAYGPPPAVELANGYEEVSRGGYPVVQQPTGRRTSLAESVMEGIAEAIGQTVGQTAAQGLLGGDSSSSPGLATVAAILDSVIQD